MYWINFVGPKTQKWAFIIISVQIQYIFLRFGEFNGWKQEPEVRNEHEIDVFSFLHWDLNFVQFTDLTLSPSVHNWAPKMRPEQAENATF